MGFPALKPFDRRRNWYHLTRIGLLRNFGHVAIPEWDDEDIEDIERLDVHGSRCRCSYCKARLHVVQAEQAFRAARREGERQAKVKARRAAARTRKRAWRERERIDQVRLAQERLERERRIARSVPIYVPPIQMDAPAIDFDQVYRLTRDDDFVAYLTGRELLAFAEKAGEDVTVIESGSLREPSVFRPASALRRDRVEVPPEWDGGI